MLCDQNNYKILILKIREIFSEIFPTNNIIGTQIENFKITTGSEN